MNKRRCELYLVDGQASVRGGCVSSFLGRGEEYSDREGRVRRSASYLAGNINHNSPVVNRKDRKGPSAENRRGKKEEWRTTSKGSK